LERFETGWRGIAAGWDRRKQALRLFCCFWRVQLSGFERWIEWLSIWNSLARAVLLLVDGLRRVLMRWNWVRKWWIESQSSRV
jgi:hypothetical protein